MNEDVRTFAPRPRGAAELVSEVSRVGGKIELAYLGADPEPRIRVVNVPERLSAAIKEQRAAVVALLLEIDPPVRAFEPKAPEPARKPKCPRCNRRTLTDADLCDFCQRIRKALGDLADRPVEGLPIETIDEAMDRLAELERACVTCGQSNWRWDREGRVFKCNVCHGSALGIAT